MVKSLTRRTCQQLLHLTRLDAPLLGRFLRDHGAALGVGYWEGLSRWLGPRLDVLVVEVVRLRVSS